MPSKHTLTCISVRFDDTTQPVTVRCVVTGVTGTKGSGYGRSPRKGGGRKIAGAAPPRHTGGVAHRGGGGGGGGGSRKRSKAKPEWVDLPVGPMPRV